ncbi:MAG TPA: hypothetical protein VFZ74_12255 [Burkholderiales bacterium]
MSQDRKALDANACAAMILLSTGRFGPRSSPGCSSFEFVFIYAGTGIMLLNLRR